jgi:transposase
MHYRICIRGHLDPSWQERFAGLRLEPQEAGTTLHHWCKLQAEQGEQAFPGSGHQMAQEEELRRLKRELEVVRQERDILKKVVHIYSRDVR